MFPSYSRRLLGLSLGFVITACGDDLTLPDDSSPSRLEAFRGDGQEGRVGSRLDDPLVVRLTDASARPVAGIPVEFRFESAMPDAEVDPANTATDNQGLASTQVRLGTNTGPHIVEARVAETSASQLRATFGLTALAKEKGKGGGDDDDDDDDD